MDALEFCAALMEKLSLEGRGQFRLPREAEWEYACRVGTTTDYYTGNGEVALKAAGWYFGNSGKETHPVGQLVPNLWNLHDMHGNVWEWCSDWYGDYSSSQTTDPNGPVSGTLRVNRGGAWDSPTEDCRSACRGRYFPVARNSNLGFRVALVLKD
jgi:formylglycine-generating enzyme required for sulfatase activity